MPLECCICTDVLIAAHIKVSSTPCGHVYHTPCIFDWINKCENGANCPVCRRAFQPSEVVPLDVVSDEDVTAIAKAISEQITLENTDEENQQPIIERRPLPELGQFIVPFIPILPLLPTLPIRTYLPVFNPDESSDEDYEETYGPYDDPSDARPVQLSFDEGNYESSEEDTLSEAEDVERSIDEGTNQSSQDELLSEGNSQNSDDFDSNGDSIDQNDYGLNEQEDLNDTVESIDDFCIENASDVHEVELSFEDCTENEHLDIDNDDQTSADIDQNDNYSNDSYGDQNDVDNFSNESYGDQNDVDNYSFDSYGDQNDVDNYSNDSYGGNDFEYDYD